MTETTATPGDTTVALAPRRTVRMVINYSDEASVSRRLAILDAPGRIVIRPTPARSPSDLVWDVLAAAGKNPATVRSERLSITNAWKAAAAWLTAAQATDLVIDRAHRLTTDEALDLAELADTIGADLWLIWSSPQTTIPMKESLECLGRDRKYKPRGPVPSSRAVLRPVAYVSLDQFHQAMPLPRPAALDALLPDEGAALPHSWPRLPATDFPLFLAVCRRTLPGDTFDALDLIYRHEAQRTDQWLRRHRNTLLHARTVEFHRSLNAYLRDERLGVAPTAGDALIRLRAIQASLLVHGILLRWQPDALGPDPAKRLLTWLTPGVCRALRATVATDAAAATVIALHLNSSPDRFAHLLCRNVDEHGRYLYLSNEESARFIRADWARQPGTEPDDETLTYGHTAPKVPLPQYAAEIVAAHLAHRRAEGSGTRGPFFTDATETELPATGRVLRPMIKRTCRRLGVDPFWMHRGVCRDGDTIGLTPAHPGADWMHARHLDSHLFAADVGADL
ncbi:hypothetical protein [Streptomyces sp. NPDC046685]|uniref:hypothetical protein n=1 Tax=Streptomyces sp. NPDC046685 TaxID=3157202 RepID=UPI0033E9865A